MNGTFHIPLQKEKNVRKMPWIKTHKRSKTPTELKTCLGNNNYLLRFRNMTQKSIVFSAAVRGFHVYKMSWKPEEGEILECLHEETTPTMFFLLKYANQITHKVWWGILPMEVSRITKFILQRGARVQGTVTGKYYRRSSLI